MLSKAPISNKQDTTMSTGYVNLITRTYNAFLLCKISPSTATESMSQSNAAGLSGIHT